MKQNRDYKNPVFIEKCRQASLKRWANPLSKCNSEEYKQKRRNIFLKEWANPTSKLNSKECREKKRQKMLNAHAALNSVYKTNEYKNKIRKTTLQNWANSDFKNKHKIYNTEEYKQKLREARLKLWADPTSKYNSKEYSNKQRIKAKRGFIKRRVREEKERLQRIKKFNKGRTNIEETMFYILQRNNIIFTENTNISRDVPDFIIKNKKIAIYCDGDYFHANPCKYISTDYIRKAHKFANEIWEKDKRVTERLEKQGYTVLRFWGVEIEHATDDVENIIKSIVG